MLDKLILTAFVFVIFVFFIAITDRHIDFIPGIGRIILTAVFLVGLLSLPIMLLIKIWG